MFRIVIEPRRACWCGVVPQAHCWCAVEAVATCVRWYRCTKASHVGAHIPHVTVAHCVIHAIASVVSHVIWHVGHIVSLPKVVAI